MTLIDLFKVMDDDVPVLLRGQTGEKIAEGQAGDVLCMLAHESLERWTVKSVWMSNIYKAIVIDVER